MPQFPQQKPNPCWVTQGRVRGGRWALHPPLCPACSSPHHQESKEEGAAGALPASPPPPPSAVPAAAPQADLERVLPADVVRGLHSCHTEAEEGDAAQDALLLLIWWANIGVTHTGSGRTGCAPPPQQQRAASCCSDTVPLLLLMGARQARPPVGTHGLPVAAQQLLWLTQQPAQLFMPILGWMPGLSPASCQGGWGRCLR